MTEHPQTEPRGQSVLYISYTGMLEPLGQSQVLPYLRHLAASHRIALLSFEKPADLADLRRLNELAGSLRALGIEWCRRRYHKRPSLPATAFDICAGTATALRLAWRHRPDIVHARSYVAGVMALAVKRTTGAKYVFDMRGFWPDEKADAGAWRRRSLTYRAAKWFEKRLLKGADTIVSLTHSGADAIRSAGPPRRATPPIEVITTCTDLALFRPAPPGAAHHPFTLGYVGSVGGLYLFDEVLESFKVLLEAQPGAQLLVVNSGDHAAIRATIARRDLPADRVRVTTARYSEVAAHIQQMDAGLFFIRPTYSKQASAPTRLGEMLACGVPVLANAGIGDIESIIGRDRVGVVVREFSVAARAAAVQDLLRLASETGIGARCRATAVREFALERGIAAYDAIYRRLAPPAPLP